MADQSNIQSAASKSIRPFRSSEEYLEAMKEDLAEWFNALYDLDMAADTFLEVLATGCDLCQHANNVNRVALEFQQRHPEAAARIPRNEVTFQARNVAPGSFVARDNVSNFIRWCRQDLGIQDVLMFETNDLVLKKNEKNVILCLLEVARRGSKFGMLAPMLIQMEEEIEEELRDQTCGVLGAPRGSQALRPTSPAYPGQAQRVSLCDLRNLDELVRGTAGLWGSRGSTSAPRGGRASVRPTGSCRSSGGRSIHPTQVFMANGEHCCPWEVLSIHPTRISVVCGRFSPATQPGSLRPVGCLLCPLNCALCGSWEVLDSPAGLRAFRTSWEGYFGAVITGKMWVSPPPPPPRDGGDTAAAPHCPP